MPLEHSPKGGTVTCSLGGLPNGGSATITIGPHRDEAGDADQHGQRDGRPTGPGTGEQQRHCHDHRPGRLDRMGRAAGARRSPSRSTTKPRPVPPARDVPALASTALGCELHQKRRSPERPSRLPRSALRPSGGRTGQCRCEARPPKVLEHPPSLCRWSGGTRAPSGAPTPPNCYRMPRISTTAAVTGAPTVLRAVERDFGIRRHARALTRASLVMKASPVRVRASA